LTGDGGAVQGRGNAFITARLASASVTGVAAFNDAHFSINEETGLVGLINPYDPDRPAFNPNDFVVGSTGSVSLTGNVARTNTAQTFSGLQTFSNGISGVGATFSGNITLGSAATDTSTIYGTKIINEGIYNNGSLRTANINFNNGQVQTLTGVGTGATGVTAIYFTGAPSTGAASVTLLITNGGQMTGDGMTGWGGNIKWPGGIKPVLTTSGIDVVSFVTPDAGTTIYGFVGGLNFA
jgi:hypothetical protein